ncbi:hypothetical protein [Aliarcobacter skirrowii]|uniref:Membrane protein n=1 Tax=Aliarcobacter skirrowii CCUG 10374 TaxID=1032239 RepID=A0AAD0SNB0_9BACT|nr:hypothetical protein [Aliarcobacter skirrowii]AXX85322.1 putative membrane protein [Aliarcobacter skirrowii CCUG 10374]KAB0620145.1 hypothetical protein F7P70_08890 [Aliarcobacter skirrowii CCUG 10374]RXI25212.1 hypothetical protein CP959_08920 [Aliarcobacter skirrowii CCUG 10374]SUU96144.1 Uncharacterised protein [Aliarcobacter skirrowii]
MSKLLFIIQICIILYIIKMYLSILPNKNNLPFKKTKKQYKNFVPDYDYKMFYFHYEIDKEHPKYKDFDFDKFDNLLESKMLLRNILIFLIIIIQLFSYIFID